MKKIVFGLLAFVSVISCLFPSIGICANTFTCTGGSFQKSINSFGGQCVDYVNYETGIGLSGDGGDWFQNAQTAGYATGLIPRESAIIVFAKSGTGGLRYGHVGIVKGVDGNIVTLRHSNWKTFSDCSGNCQIVSEDKIDINKYYDNILGYIYCDGNIEENTVDVTVPSQSEYGWTGGGDNCLEGNQHYLFDSSGQGVLVPKEQACNSVTQICASPPSQSEVSQMTNETKKSFWSSVWSAITNVAHDLFGADARAACETNIGYRTIRVATSSNTARILSNSYADLKIFHPDSIGLTSTNIKPDPLPNLQVQHFYVYNSTDTSQLVESISSMNVGSTYNTHVWVVSQDADAEVGAQSGTENINTDVFYKIALSEPTSHWKHLGRVYTRPSSLPEDNGHKEVLSLTVPPEAAGQRIYFRAKVDSTGEIKETNEHDNWSDIEWYPVPGSCDLIASYARLTGGRTSVFEGEQYAFETSIKNIGPNPCPIDTRNAYYEKKPGSSSWTYVTDDSTSAHDLVPNQENYEVILSDLPVANTPGIHEIMVCADYLNSNQETDESNNCTTSSFEVKAYRPDLVISAVGLTGGRTSLLQGDTFGLSMTITNQGNAPATVDTRSAYYLMPPGSSTWAYQTDDLTTATQMCVGCSKAEWNTTDPYTANAVGTWQGMTCADNWNWQSELDENNNCKTFSFNVAPAGPDLVVTQASLTNGRTSLTVGDRYGLRMIITNQGNRSATSDIRSAYYVKIPGATTWQYLMDDGTASSHLCVGCSTEEYTTNEPFTAYNAGLWQGMSCADYQGAVPETNESNNCMTYTFMVNFPRFAWSNSGPIAGMYCTQITEGAEPASHTWNDNYFCSDLNIGMRWSSAGAIAGMKCTKIHEAADPNTWGDNYLCIPSSNPIQFYWNGAGPIAGKKCVQWYEPNDPHTWADNYLCYD